MRPPGVFIVSFPYSPLTFLFSDLFFPGVKITSRSPRLSHTHPPGFFSDRKEIPPPPPHAFPRPRIFFELLNRVTPSALVFLFSFPRPLFEFSSAPLLRIYPGFPPHSSTQDSHKRGSFLFSDFTSSSPFFFSSPSVFPRDLTE